jgi:hypothetical protein
VIVDKINGFLGRFVGPNAAHMIDAGIALAIAAGIALAASPAARTFEQHHSLLGILVSVGVLLGTPLVSKFRKAAGSSAPLVDQLVAAVAKAVADAHEQLPPSPK